jgi:hypothetical protein
MTKAQAEYNLNALRFKFGGIGSLPVSVDSAQKLVPPGVQARTEEPAAHPVPAAPRDYFGMSTP